MYILKKQFGCEYSHRLSMDYESACKNLHGHSAIIYVEIHCPKLNKDNMVIDFTHLKPIQQWIDCHWDHSLILNSNDPLLKIPEIKKMKHFIVNNMDPTSEVLAKILWEKTRLMLDNLKIQWGELAITFYETAKNCATYKRVK